MSQKFKQPCTSCDGKGFNWVTVRGIKVPVPCRPCGGRGTRWVDRKLKGK